jgi:murein DD-endopeptidase MepM/ murein hydrolase activator NlpD
MGWSFKSHRGGFRLPEVQIIQEFTEFWLFFWDYAYRRIYRVYRHFEGGKGVLVDLLYQRRGKYSRAFVHAGMAVLLFLGVTVGPLIIKSREDQILASELPQAEVLGISTDDTFQMGMRTIPSEGVVAYRGGEIVDYTVQAGQTLSQIADKFGLKVDTILWANGLDSDKVKIREGQVLKIPPVDGVIHKVKKGETVYSIAKKYEANPQAMVDYPFNEFTNDETFALAIGQVMMVPDGVMPEVVPLAPKQYLAAQLTPNAGVVSALGSFVWPASGAVTQSYKFYHKAIDIANKVGGSILAADSGRVTVAGWPDNYGYGNRVMIDHGNGYVTLYGHMSKVAVAAGQSVNRGDVIGYMGSTGRSTGVHVHFEIRAGGGLQNPLNFLK